MKQITIGKMNLYYPDNVTEKEIDTWIAIIKKNRAFIDISIDSTVIIDHNSTDKIKVEDNNTFVVNQFDEFFDYQLRKTISNEKLQETMNLPELMPIVYILLLLKENDIDKENVIFSLLPEDLTEDDLYFFVAFKCFDHINQFNELANFLKTRKNQNQIFECFQKIERFNAYNYLLETFASILDKEEPGILSMMEDILYKMRIFTFTSVVLNSKEDIPIPSLSLEQVEILFLDFLRQINSPEEWFNLYYFLKAKNYITFEKINITSQQDSSECYLDTEDLNYKLRICNHDNLHTFISLVHEFIHYVTLQKGEKFYALLEFPSIYYERKAKQYLIDKGYDPKMVENILFRVKYNHNNYSVSNELLSDIAHYSKGNSIRREEKILALEKEHQLMIQAQRLLNPELQSIDSSILENRDYGKEVDEACDYYIIESTMKMDALMGIEYPVADYLVQKILEINDPMIEQKMIDVTTNLVDYNVSRLLEYFSLTEVFKQEVTDNELHNAINNYQKQLR